MPRTCRACASSQREAIAKALVAGESLRNIAKRVSISPAGLLRHKSHVGGAIAKAQADRDEWLGEDLLEEMRRLLRKAWELLAKTEAEGDHRGSIVALRGVRECLESLGEMLRKADGVRQDQGVQIVVRFVRDPETPPVRVPERPILDVAGRCAQTSDKERNHLRHFSNVAK